AGGKTVYNQIDSVGEIAAQIRRNIERPGWYTARRTAASVIEAIEAVNDGIENAMRLSVYKHGRDIGMSPQEAANIAKNITVNFNRHGEWGPSVNAFYPFFNVSVQGTMRFLETMRKNPKQASAVA